MPDFDVLRSVSAAPAGFVHPNEVQPPSTPAAEGPSGLVVDMREAVDSDFSAAPASRPRVDDRRWERMTQVGRSIECVRLAFPRFVSDPPVQFSRPGHRIQGHVSRFLETVDPTRQRRCFIKVLYPDKASGRWDALGDVFTNEMLSNTMASKRTDNEVALVDTPEGEVMVSISYVVNSKSGVPLKLVSPDELHQRFFWMRPVEAEVIPDGYEFDSWLRVTLMLKISNSRDATSDNRQAYKSKKGKVKEVVFDARFDKFDEDAETHYEAELVDLPGLLYDEYKTGRLAGLPSLEEGPFRRRFVEAARKLVKNHPQFQENINRYRSDESYRAKCEMWKRWASYHCPEGESAADEPWANPEKTLEALESRYKRMVDAINRLDNISSPA